MKTITLIVAVLAFLACTCAYVHGDDVDSTALLEIDPELRSDDNYRNLLGSVSEALQEHEQVAKQTVDLKAVDALTQTLRAKADKFYHSPKHHAIRSLLQQASAPTTNKATNTKTIKKSTSTKKSAKKSKAASTQGVAAANKERARRLAKKMSGQAERRHVSSERKKRRAERKHRSQLRKAYKKQKNRSARRAAQKKQSDAARKIRRDRKRRERARLVKQQLELDAMKKKHAKELAEAVNKIRIKAALKTQQQAKLAAQQRKAATIKGLEALQAKLRKEHLANQAAAKKKHAKRQAAKQRKAAEKKVERVLLSHAMRRIEKEGKLDAIKKEVRELKAKNNRLKAHIEALKNGASPTSLSTAHVVEGGPHAPNAPVRQSDHTRKRHRDLIEHAMDQVTNEPDHKKWSINQEVLDSAQPLLRKVDRVRERFQEFKAEMEQAPLVPADQRFVAPELVATL